MSDYTTRRYGASSAKADQAWDGILATVGDTPCNSVRETPANSILMARPLRGEKARTYGNTNPSHNKARLAKAWLMLGAAAPECPVSDGYRMSGSRFPSHPSSTREKRAVVDGCP